ncbi:hemerythrin domain-containing protein [Prolixibacteraceae bacterium Z1-6]|uniref:Hemerythrin domain-containing protein n=1 Tax=Draconibacterium aestuarii TaxID=2998507 RepID=A0A9X3F9Y8_9BACT|nr:hemerythrin domain-containing protein [Prolixibacteraceae bacterium Z1-6]
MNRFTKQNKIIHLVEANYHLLPVLNRFGINLGNKDKSLEKICAAQNINIDFLLAIVNTFHNEEYFPETELKSFSPLLIIDYLKKTHQHYIEYVLPKLESLLELLIDSNITEIHQLNIIEQFYQKYKKELLLHIKEEEQEVFPYILNLVNNNQVNNQFTIHSFEKEHSNVDDKLNDLKNLIVKYIEPVYDNNICNEFLITLFRFEKDIKDHARIEDKILLPQLITLEKHING